MNERINQSIHKDACFYCGLTRDFVELRLNRDAVVEICTNPEVKFVHRWMFML